jgi:hypothetical protein
MSKHNIFHLHAPNKIAKLGGTSFFRKLRVDMLGDDITHQGNLTRENLTTRLSKTLG